MIANPGLLFAFGATICWAISVFPFTKAGRLMTVAGMNLVRLVLGTLLVFTSAAIMETDSLFHAFTKTYLQGWMWLGISGVLALGVGDYFGLRMYAILGPRFGSVLSTLSPAAALLSGYILLGQNMNYIGIAGMLLTISGVMGISLGKKERIIIPDHGHGSVTSGIAFGVVSALCNGAGLACSKKAFALQSSMGVPIHPLTASFMRFSVATILVVVFLLLSGKLLPKIKKIAGQPLPVLGLAALGTVMGPLLGVSLALFAIQTVTVAVAQTIFALVPVLALAISHFVFKHKLSRAAVIGALIAIAGVSVLIWRNELALLVGF